MRVQGAEDPIVDSGICGEITWAISEKGILTLSGTGAMMDYRSSNIDERPWSEYTKQVNKVVVGEGVTHIGSFAFNNCSMMESCEIAQTVTTIGKKFIV